MPQPIISARKVTQTIQINQQNLTILKEIDLEINRLENAESISKRPYEFVILSDHGQGNGATFKQRYGITLGNFVRRFLPEDMKSLRTDEESDHFRNSYIPKNESIENISEKNLAMKYSDYISALVNKG